MDDLDAIIGELNASASPDSPLLERSSRVDDWLAEVVRRKGSDLLLVAGRPPTVRIDGLLSPVADLVLDGEDIAAAITPLLPPHAARPFRDSGIADASLRLATPGTYMIVMETNHTGSELPFVRFNDYARDEGLTPIIAARAKAGSTGTTGREIYSRRATALIQVGNTRTPNVTRPIGLTLEIVPQVNPYALAASAAFPVQVLYEGKPLAGATIKLNNLDFDAKPLAIKLTDRTGRASFDVPRTGRWQLNVVWSKPVKGNPAADFDTTFSSLAFGWR